MVTIAVTAVVLLATTGATALVIASSVLHSMTTDIAESVESVRLTEEAEVSLLLHARTQDPIARQQHAIDMRRHLVDAERHIIRADERRAHAEAEVAVDAYLADGGPAREAAAFGALEQLSQINVAHARDARDRATRWDRFADIAALVLGGALIGVAVGLVIWLRRRVIKPLYELAATMRRFGTGDRTARAVEQGPDELRDMSARFNELADAIAAQRQLQIAFLGGIAHDLRNPLSSLRLAIEMVPPNEPLPPEPQLRRTLGIVSRQIDHLDRMVGDFLDMSKIEAGELEIRLDRRDVRDIVRDSVDLFAAPTRERIRVTMPDEPIVVTCDPVRIGQAVTNLVSNAVKYSPPDQPIAISVDGKDHDVTIEVADRGVGIPPDDQRRIFEPFQRGKARGDVPGAGLGLFSVQRIVQAHGGHIELESAPAVGSTFRIHLPA